ncbi:hypothetical protein glysoja_008505 [Glycine soja]|nr:hypothetical protein glysoja_008505 [Glycine soja]
MQNKQFEENLEQWPHLNELVHCYTTDWVKDENKYGHYDSVGTPSFHNQIYEGPDTDIETEMRLAGARQTKGDEVNDDDIPSTSGRQFTEGVDGDLLPSDVPKHIGQSPLPAYEPAFDWENERTLIFGQRIPETPLSHGMKISVKVQSLQFQAGLAGECYVVDIGGIMW